jgi:hypothetical protein
MAFCTIVTRINSKMNIIFRINVKNYIEPDTFEKKTAERTTGRFFSGNDFATNPTYNNAQSQIRTILSQGVSFVIPLDIRGLVLFFRLTYQKMQNFMHFQHT